MKKSTIFFSLAISFPVIILLALSFLPVMTYLNGKVILLETQPVDPRDLFRGDYVNLSFKINDVPISLFPEELRKETTFEGSRSKNLYAVLKKEGNYFTIEQMSFGKPNNQYYLWAKVNLYGALNESFSDTIFVEYPIDRYFIPEGTGEELEDLSRKGELVAKIKVWNGYPLLIAVYPKEE